MTIHAPLLKKGGMLPTPGGGVGGFDKSELYDDPQYATEQHHADPDYRMPFGQKGTEPEQNKFGARTHNKYKDSGLLNRSDMLKWMRHWENMGHSPQVYRIGKLYRCLLDLDVKPLDPDQHHPIHAVQKEGEKTAAKGCRCNGWTDSADDSSVCACGHQWHEHWHLGDFGCKHEKTSAVEEKPSAVREAAIDFAWQRYPRDQWPKVSSTEPSEPSYRAAQVLVQFGRIKKEDVRFVAMRIDQMTSHPIVHYDMTPKSHWDTREGKSAKMGVSETPVKVIDDLDLDLKGKTAFFEPGEDFLENLKMGGPGLDGYIFRSDLYCPKCGQDIIDKLVYDGEIGPPDPNEDASWVQDSDIVPQPVFHLEPGTETCSYCNKELKPGGEPSGWSWPGHEPGYEKSAPPEDFTPEDREFLHGLGIQGSVDDLVKKVIPRNPLLQPSEPDPEDASFFKESEEDKTASTQSYGMGTPPGGASNSPAAEEGMPDKSMGFQPMPEDPLAKPAWTPPAPPTESHNPEMDKDVAKEVVEELTRRMAGQAVSEVDIHEDPESLPPRTELRKHLDDTLVDDTGKPPIPLHKGAGRAKTAQACPNCNRHYDQQAREDCPYCGHLREGDEEWGSIADQGYPAFCPNCNNKRLGYFPSQEEAENALSIHYQKFHPEVPRKDPIWLGDIPAGHKGHRICPDCGDNLGGIDQEALARHLNIHLRQKAKRTMEPQAEKRVKNVTFTPEDRKFLQGMGIKASKAAGMEEKDPWGTAAVWWAKTPNAQRRAVAEKLGIDRYWSHFTWDSLPKEVQEQVVLNLPDVTSPLKLTTDDERLLKGMGVQAAAKDWDPGLAYDLLNSGMEALENGQIEKATQDLRNSILHNHYNGPAHFLLGIALALDGEGPASVSELEAASPGQAFRQLCLSQHHKAAGP